jgi:hypothetical protein
MPGAATTPYQYAVAVTEQHADWLMDQPGVVGVGVGRTRLGQPYIQVYLRSNDRSARAHLPKRLDGLPVRFEVTGDITAV